VCAAFIEKGVLEDFVGFRKSLVHVAEFKRNSLVDVAFFAIVVNSRFGRRESFLRIGDRWQEFVFDIDQV